MDRGETPSSTPPTAPDGPRRPSLPGWAANALGIGLLALAALTVVGLLPPGTPPQGVLLARWVRLWRMLLGWGAWAVPFVLGWLGLRLLQVAAGPPPPWRWGRWLAGETAYFALLALLGVLHAADLSRALAGYDGGLVGWSLAALLLKILPDWLAVMGLLAIALGAGSVAVGLWAWLGQRLQPVLPASTAPTGKPAPVETQRHPTPAPSAPAGAAGPRKAGLSPKKPKEKPQTTAQPQQMALPLRDKNLPPLDLLDAEQEGGTDRAYIEAISRKIEETLAEFEVPARVVGVRVGPSVIQFAVEPGFVEKPTPDGPRRQRVRVAQIVNLRRDLALALAVRRLRIQAPVPGQPYVGIEIPNPKTRLVRLRPLLESPEFHKVNSPLAIAVGRGVAGEVVAADLATMPHLLVAGTTGSGKSIFLKALLLTLVMNLPPQDLRLILIDPKRVELSHFRGLPHLMGPVEGEPKRVLALLQWVVAEMQRRYRLFEKARVRDIRSYRNRLARQGKPPLPYLVVVIDELADLMMHAPEQTEFALVRLAQLARATGIHLVVSTQRPSVDVITGLIKANFPARVAFQVASSVDSRVILDQPGAESLLGRGDMLFQPPDAPAPLRVQGPFVSEREIRRVVAFWQQAEGPPEEAPPPWENLVGDEEEGPRWDPLLEEAARIVIETQRAHTSLIQRRLRIGYPRAARIMEQLERLGIVGPASEGSRERVVLVEPGTPFHLEEEGT